MVTITDNWTSGNYDQCPREVQMVCGNIVEMLRPGKGQLVCCGEPMVLFTENTEDASIEKVPVITKVDGGFKVTVGSVEHPW